jgi:hypothetical protein
MTASLTLLIALAFTAADVPNGRPFAITVVDDQSGRGVPLVELKTVNEVRYVTDSAGVAAVFEPGLMGESVFFHVKSHGYEYPKDGFGYRGKALVLTEGGSATLKIHRVNIAERLYRVTGAGVYRDTILTGRPAPIRQPLLNAQVFGQDSVLMARYRGKLYWFWGDTNRPGYPLGNFHTPGATSDPPGEGGLDPEAGVDLTYFVDENGFARPTARMPGDGPTWLGGLAAFRDEDGAERLVAGYAKVRPSMETYEHGLVAFNPAGNIFEKIATFPLDAPIRPAGHTFQRKDGDANTLYYGTPLPLTRVRARMADLADVTRYEAFTCLEPGSRLDAPKLDRGPDGRLRYAWRANTPAVGPSEQARLVKEGKIKADEALLALRDADTGKAVLAHNGSVYWNEYRNRWVAVFTESFGASSILGEIWFAEADTPLGPWVYARKVVTHDKYSFYNPKQHPELAKEGGRIVFFEGTYTTSFSGNNDPTPRYEYNQVMYRLDLSDPRLNLPAPVYALSDGTFASGLDAARLAGSAPPAFFALGRPGDGTVAVLVKGKAAFHVLPADLKDAPKAAVPLFEANGGYTTNPSGGRRRLGLAWSAPTSVRIPVP